MKVYTFFSLVSQKPSKSCPCTSRRISVGCPLRAEPSPRPHWRAKLRVSAVVVVAIAVLVVVVVAAVVVVVVLVVVVVVVIMEQSYGGPALGWKV